MPQPTVITFLSDMETPVSLFHKISQTEPTTFLLESTDGDTRLARFSFIGVAPSKTIWFRHGEAVLHDFQTGQETRQKIENPLTLLEKVIKEEAPRFALPQDQKPLPFSGGWVGYMGYGATEYFDGIPHQAEDPLNVPDGYYGFYDSFVMFDHLFKKISFISYRLPEEATALWTELAQSIGEAKPLQPLPYEEDPDDSQIFEDVTGPLNEETFCNTVRKAKTYIQEGQVFQIVVSHRFTKQITSEPIDVYRMLQAINPSPYSYFLKFPEFVYCGSSPETFMRCHDRIVVLRALAGTRPRGLTEEEDIRLAQELRANEKELAEHHMLVDLGRNDLGRICEVGTLKVGEIATLTRYSHVMHLATELTGKLRLDKTVFDIFKSCFPRGTVSGAPKIRAMHLLSQLEPECRGVYSGVVGYFDVFGNTDGAIAIRSALIKDGQAHVNAGAGVVHDSDPAAEYQETRNKAKSILKAIHQAEKVKRYAHHHH